MLVFLWRSHYYECWCWVWSRRPPTVCYLSVSIVMVVVASTCFRPGASRCLRRGRRMRWACLRRLRRVKHRSNSQPTRTYMFLVRQVSLDIDQEMWPPITRQAKVIDTTCFHTVSHLFLAKTARVYCYCTLSTSGILNFTTNSLIDDSSRNPIHFYLY